MFYKDGDKKILSKPVLDKITYLSLAIWYMDDGSMCVGKEDGRLGVKNVRSRAMLHAGRYGKDGVELISKYLKERFGLESSLVYDKRKNFYSICLNADSSEIFYSNICAYIPESMGYKIPIKFREGDKIPWWNSRYIDKLYPDSITEVRELSSMALHKNKKTVIAYDMEVENSHTYIANGFAVHNCRAIILKDSSGFHIYSRHNSDVDFLPIEFTEKVMFADGFSPDMIKDNFMLDCEMTSDTARLNTVMDNYGVVTETALQALTSLISSDTPRALAIQKKENLRLTFNFFDCIWYNGQWITNQPLIERRKLAFELYNKLLAAGFKIRPVRSNRTNKKQFYKNIILNGGEGVVSKCINGIYVPDTNRRDDGWIKIKRSMSEMSGEESYGDTIDAFITGAVPGEKGKGLENLIGAVCVSVNLKKYDGTYEEHEIARISGLDLKLRQDMTEMVGGIPTLKPSYYGRVIEIDGAGISSRNRHFRHAVFLGFRYDKDANSCTMDEEFLDKMIL
jgi:hypothetical protein